MANKVPAYIIKHAEALERAHAAVDKHAQAIEEWVNKNGGDGDKFFFEYHLDMPYEYIMKDTIDGLKNL